MKLTVHFCQVYHLGVIYTHNCIKIWNIKLHSFLHTNTSTLSLTRCLHSQHPRRLLCSILVNVFLKGTTVLTDLYYLFLTHPWMDSCSNCFLQLRSFAQKWLMWVLCILLGVSGVYSLTYFPADGHLFFQFPFVFSNFLPWIRPL